MKPTRGWRRHWSAWLDRRIPPASRMTLSHRSIFILPTRSGLMYGVLLLLLLVTAINYQNSLIYALTFWLFSVALAAMLFTFRNLSGLTLIAGHALPCFAGERLQLPLRLQAAGREYDALRLGFPGELAQSADVPAHTNTSVLLHRVAEKRGPLQLERLRLESRFPLGLFNAWSWVKLDFRGLVYPRPEYVPFVFVAGDEGEQPEGVVSQRSGDQDFQGLRPYRSGDSLKRIAWKQLARGKGLVSKDFDRDEGATCWLAWEALAGMPVEMRLSRLCGWVLQAHQNGWRYGLRLPGTELPPDHSDAHRDRCLKALALFGFQEAMHE